MSAKVKQKRRSGFAPDDYVKVFNPHDFNDLALLLEDLDLIVGAPVDKAYQKFRSSKERGFPFF